MYFSIIVSVISIILMMICIIIKPSIKIGNKEYSTFYIPILLGAIILLVNPSFDKSALINIVFSNSKLNPIKILILFISFSFLSVSLDESGFFAYVANKFINRFKTKQITLFFAMYFIISVLTIFTSNDIVILTFTPFIFYFSKHGRINPIPYLVMEFVSANTYSLFLPIGNPTNIYLTTIFDINFLEYIKVLFFPTILIGLTSVIIIMLIFRNDLKEPINVFSDNEVKIKNKTICFVALAHLGIATTLLVISNYLQIEMWLIACISGLSLLIFTTIYAIIHKEKEDIIHPIKRLPYSLIPFVLSMFVIIMSLDYYGIFSIIYGFVEEINKDSIKNIIYLFSSTLSCNLVNNIPMTIAYGSILANTNNLNYVFITIIGSNIGAIITPVGALAGIMWMHILKENDVKYGFKDFARNGLMIIGPILIVLAIYIILLF